MDLSFSTIEDGIRFSVKAKRSVDGRYNINFLFQGLDTQLTKDKIISISTRYGYHKAFHNYKPYQTYSYDYGVSGTRYERLGVLRQIDRDNKLDSIINE